MINKKYNEQKIINSINFDPNTIESKDSKIKEYSMLRNQCPVYWDDQNKSWLITKYEDVEKGLRDFKTYSSSHGESLIIRDLYSISDPDNISSFNLSNKDPTEYLQDRKVYVELLNNAINNNLVEFIENTIDNLFSLNKNKNNIDFIKDITNNIAIHTIWKILDYDKSMLEFISNFSKKFWLRTSPKERSLLFKEAAKFLINNPPGIFNQDYDFDKKLNFCMGMLIGGSGSMSNALPSLLYHSLTEREEFDKVINNTTLANNFIQESLRHSFMYSHLIRTASRDVEIYNSCIKEGDLVAFILSSANFDPEFYGENVNIFNIDRDYKKINLVFSNGPHLCVGHKVAMIQLNCFLEKIIKIHNKLKINNIIFKDKKNFSGGMFESIYGEYSD